MDTLASYALVGMIRIVMAVTVPIREPHRGIGQKASRMKNKTNTTKAGSVVT
jgi:hypothetical protein